MQPLRVNIQDSNGKDVQGTLIAVFDRTNIDIEGIENHETIGVVVIDNGDIVERGIGQIKAMKGIFDVSLKGK